MSDLVKRLRIKAGMIEMGEMIAWGSDSALMREAADALEMAAPAVQGEPVGWQYYQHGEWRNGDESIKGHRKNTEEAGFRVRDVYAAPQPAEQQPASDVTQLVEALEQFFEGSGIHPGANIERLMMAVSAPYRKGGE